MTLYMQFKKMYMLIFLCAACVCSYRTVQDCEKLRWEVFLQGEQICKAQAWKWITGILEQTLCDVGNCTWIICWALCVSLLLTKEERKYWGYSLIYGKCKGKKV